MTERNDSDYEAHCAAFYSIIDNDTLNDVVAAESFSVDCQLSINETVNPTCDESRAENNLTTSGREHHWNNLLINMALISELHLPEEGMYEPK